jgi:hypothetical protein
MTTKITVPADSTVNLHGHAGGIVSLPVTDSGSTPLVVRASVRDATRAALHHPGAAWVKSIRPAVLHLRPGQTGHIRLLLAAPRGAGSRAVTNVIFSAGPSGHGAVRLAAAVGGTLRIRGAGPARFIPTAAHRAATLTAAAPPWPAIGLAVFAVLVIAAGLIVWRQRKGVRGL